MKVLLTSWLVLIVLAATSQECTAVSLGNGSFETPALAPGAFLTIAPGGEPAGFVWSVTSGDVDVGNLPIVPFVQYSAYDGLQVLDLNGTTSGALRQDFATVPGQAYNLSFAYADNPFEGGVSSASINVTDVGTSGVLLVDSVSHSSSTNSPPNADWMIYSSNFIAAGLLTRLAFASTSASTTASGGIALDAVNIIEVPEPSTFALAALGCIGLAAARWRLLRADRKWRSRWLRLL